MDMNMMYLSPSYRRDFLDDILSTSFPLYDKINKDYKNIVKNRNKLLKSIKE
jgi:recombinational DNA repair ATPase RecF